MTGQPHFTDFNLGHWMSCRHNSEYVEFTFGTNGQLTTEEMFASAEPDGLWWRKLRFQDDRVACTLALGTSADGMRMFARYDAPPSGIDILDDPSGEIRAQGAWKRADDKIVQALRVWPYPQFTDHIPARLEIRGGYFLGQWRADMVRETVVFPLGVAKKACTRQQRYPADGPSAWHEFKVADCWQRRPDGKYHNAMLSLDATSREQGPDHLLLLLDDGEYNVRTDARFDRSTAVLAVEPGKYPVVHFKHGMTDDALTSFRLYDIHRILPGRDFSDSGAKEDISYVPSPHASRRYAWAVAEIAWLASQERGWPVRSLALQHWHWISWWMPDSVMRQFDETPRLPASCADHAVYMSFSSAEPKL